MRAKAYRLGDMEFKRQRDLEEEVKRHLNAQPLNREFHDDFLALVVNELHDEVKAAGQRSTGRFIYLDFEEQVRRGMPTAARFRGGKLLMTYFEPLGDWRDVTVYPWRKPDPKREIKAALREIIAPYLPRPTVKDACAVSGCGARGFDLEYEHVDPTFDAIAEACLSLMSEEEIRTRFGYNKFAPGALTVADFIPRDHPAVRCLVEAHGRNKWVWLCKRHHRKVGAEG